MHALVIKVLLCYFYVLLKHISYVITSVCHCCRCTYVYHVTVPPEEPEVQSTCAMVLDDRLSVQTLTQCL
jgi:hypothetical protein